MKPYPVLLQKNPNLSEWMRLASSVRQSRLLGSRDKGKQGEGLGEGGVLTWRYGGWVESPRRERGLSSREVGVAFQSGSTCSSRVRQQDSWKHLVEINTPFYRQKQRANGEQQESIHQFLNVCRHFALTHHLHPKYRLIGKQQGCTQWNSGQIVRGNHSANGDLVNYTNY